MTLVSAIILGLLFGFVLQKSGAANPQRIIEMLHLKHSYSYSDVTAFEHFCLLNFVFLIENSSVMSLIPLPFSKRKDGALGK